MNKDTLVIKGEIEYVAGDPLLQPTKILVYPSAHVPIVGQGNSTACVLGSKGSFEIRAFLSPQHKYAKKVGGQISFLAESFIGFDLLRKTSRESARAMPPEEHDAGDASSPRVPRDIGYSILGTSQFGLAAAIDLSRDLSRKNLPWGKLRPSIPVDDRYDMLRSQHRGRIYLKNLEIAAHGLIQDPHHRLSAARPNPQAPSSEDRDALITDLGEFTKRTSDPNEFDERLSRVSGEALFIRFDQDDDRAVCLANRSIQEGFSKSSAFRPTVSALESIHCPYLACARCKSLGPSYPMPMPATFSSESFFSELIASELHSTAVPHSWFVSTVDMQMKLPVNDDKVLGGFPLARFIAGRALSRLTTSCYYSEDFTAVEEEVGYSRISGGGTGDHVPVRVMVDLPSDRYTLLRETLTDDCDGLAKEEVLEHQELTKGLQNGLWKTPLVIAFANALKWNVPMLVHGLVRTKPLGDEWEAAVPPAPTAYDEKLVGIDAVVGGEWDLSEEATMYASLGNPDREAPCAIGSKHPFYTAESSRVRQRVIEAVERATSRDDVTSERSKFSSHCFVILDPVANFKNCMSKTPEGASFLSRYGRDSLDSSAFENVPAWNAKLPRMFVEGTSAVFPWQFPLGLMYDQHSEERSRIRDAQAARSVVLFGLAVENSAIRDLVHTRYGDRASTTMRNVTRCRWGELAGSFYWMPVGAYVPTVCVEDPRAVVVMREIAFVQASSVTPTTTVFKRDGTSLGAHAANGPPYLSYGVLASDLAIGRDDSIGYMPTDTWSADESDMVRNQMLTEIPIPPILRDNQHDADWPSVPRPDHSAPRRPGVRESAYASAMALESKLISYLPNRDAQWIVKMNRGRVDGSVQKHYPTPTVYEQAFDPKVGLPTPSKEDLLPLPKNSIFDHSRGGLTKVAFSFREPDVESGYAEESLVKTLLDPSSNIEDIKVAVYNFGTPAFHKVRDDPGGKDLFYVYDVELYIRV